MFRGRYELTREFNVSERLSVLRQKLQLENVDAFVVPSEDPHFSEYPADCFRRREYISAFTGSAGVAVATADKALLFTDGRYFEQAE
jgi:Xaa-Pro aminopeptidase